MPPPRQANLPRISLIPGFSFISESEPQDFGTSSSKLLAYLALQRAPLERTAVAAALWPHVRDARAAANLRTALWRLSQLDPDLIEITGSRIGVSPDVSVDQKDCESLARRVLTGRPLKELLDDGESPRVDAQHVIRRLTGELLTHWYDEWLTPSPGALAPVASPCAGFAFVEADRSRSPCRRRRRRHGCGRGRASPGVRLPLVDGGPPGRG